MKSWIVAAALSIASATTAPKGGASVVVKRAAEASKDKFERVLREENDPQVIISEVQKPIDAFTSNKLDDKYYKSVCLSRDFGSDLQKVLLKEGEDQNLYCAHFLEKVYSKAIPSDEAMKQAYGTTFDPSIPSDDNYIKLRDEAAIMVMILGREYMLRWNSDAVTNTRAAASANARALAKLITAMRMSDQILNETSVKNE